MSTLLYLPALLKTLAAALGAADLVDALKGQGPFTVFAPTDDAFAKLPPGTVESLLKPENKQQLIAILTYHVVPGQVTAEQVTSLRGAKSLNGQRIDIAAADGIVQIDSANVVKADIMTSNGIIHVIDSVILPAMDNIPTTAEKAGNFKTLLAAVGAAGLTDALLGEGPFTVFAPTDEAFANLPAGTVESLLRPENRDKLAAILKYHVVAGRVYSEDALAAKQAATLQGDKIHVSVTAGQAMINNAKLVATDIDASNGVIHVVDSVLLPPEQKSVQHLTLLQSNILAPKSNPSHPDKPPSNTDGPVPYYPWVCRQMQPAINTDWSRVFSYWHSPNKCRFFEASERFVFKFLKCTVCKEAKLAVKDPIGLGERNCVANGKRRLVNGNMSAKGAVH